MSNYKVLRCGDICVIKEKGKTVAEMIGDIAIIKVKGLIKFFCDDISAVEVKGKPKSLGLAKRKIKELERILWQ